MQNPTLKCPSFAFPGKIQFVVHLHTSFKFWLQGLKSVAEETVRYSFDQKVLEFSATYLCLLDSWTFLFLLSQIGTTWDFQMSQQMLTKLKTLKESSVGTIGLIFILFVSPKFQCGRPTISVHYKNSSNAQTRIVNQCFAWTNTQHLEAIFAHHYLQ